MVNQITSNTTPNKPPNDRRNDEEANENASENVSVNTLAGFLIDSNTEVISKSVGTPRQIYSPKTESLLRQQTNGKEATSTSVIEALNHFIYQAGNIYHRGRKVRAEEEVQLRETAKNFGLSAALVDALIEQARDPNAVVKYCMASDDMFARMIKKDKSLSRLIKEGKERGSSAFDLAGSVWRVFMLKIVQQFLKDQGMEIGDVMEQSSLTARLYEQAVQVRRTEYSNHRSNQCDLPADSMRIRNFTEERKKVSIPASEARRARRAADAMMTFSPSPMFHGIVSDDNSHYAEPLRRQSGSNNSDLDSRDDGLSTRPQVSQSDRIPPARTSASSLPPIKSPEGLEKTLPESKVQKRCTPNKIDSISQESNNTEQPLSAVKRALAFFEGANATDNKIKDQTKKKSVLEEIAGKPLEEKMGIQQASVYRSGIGTTSPDNNSIRSGPSRTKLPPRRARSTSVPPMRPNSDGEPNRQNKLSSGGKDRYLYHMGIERQPEDISVISSGPLSKQQQSLTSFRGIENDIQVSCSSSEDLKNDVESNHIHPLHVGSKSLCDSDHPDHTGGSQSKVANARALFEKGNSAPSFLEDAEPRKKLNHSPVREKVLEKVDNNPPDNEKGKSKDWKYGSHSERKLCEDVEGNNDVVTSQKSANPIDVDKSHKNPQIGYVNTPSNPNQGDSVPDSIRFDEKSSNSGKLSSGVSVKSAVKIFESSARKGQIDQEIAEKLQKPCNEVQSRPCKAWDLQPGKHTYDTSSLGKYSSKVPHQNDIGQCSLVPTNEMTSLHRVPDVVTVDPDQDRIDVIFSSFTQSSSSEDDLVPKEASIASARSRGFRQFKNSPRKWQNRSSTKRGPATSQLRANNWNEMGQETPSDEGTHNFNRSTIQHQDSRRILPHKDNAEILSRKGSKAENAYPRSNLVSSSAVHTEITLDGQLSPGPVSRDLQMSYRGGMTKKSTQEEEEDEKFFESFFSTGNKASVRIKSRKEYGKQSTISENQEWVSKVQANKRLEKVDCQDRILAKPFAKKSMEGANLSKANSSDLMGFYSNSDDTSWFPSDEGSFENAAAISNQMDQSRSPSTSGEWMHFDTVFQQDNNSRSADFRSRGSGWVDFDAGSTKWTSNTDGNRTENTSKFQNDNFHPFGTGIDSSQAIILDQDGELNIKEHNHDIETTASTRVHPRSKMKTPQDDASKRFIGDGDYDSATPQRLKSSENGKLSDAISQNKNKSSPNSNIETEQQSEKPTCAKGNCDKEHLNSQDAHATQASTGWSSDQDTSHGDWDDISRENFNNLQNMTYDSFVDPGNFDKIIEARTQDTLTDDNQGMSSEKFKSEQHYESSFEKKISFSELDKKIRAKYSDRSVHTVTTATSTSTGESTDRYKVHGGRTAKAEHPVTTGEAEIHSFSIIQSGQENLRGKRTMNMRDNSGSSQSFDPSSSHEYSMKHIKDEEDNMGDYPDIKRQKTADHSQSPLSSSSSLGSEFTGLNPLQNFATSSTRSTSSSDSDFNAMNFYNPENVKSPHETNPSNTTWTPSHYYPQKGENIVNDKSVAFDLPSQERFNNQKTNIQILKEKLMGPPKVPRSTQTKDHIQHGSTQQNLQPRIQNVLVSQTMVDRRMLPPLPNRRKSSTEGQEAVLDVQMSQADANLDEMNVYPLGKQLKDQAGACLLATGPLIETSYTPIGSDNNYKRHPLNRSEYQSANEWKNMVGIEQMKDMRHDPAQEFQERDSPMRKLDNPTRTQSRISDENVPRQYRDGVTRDAEKVSRFDPTAAFYEQYENERDMSTAAENRFNRTKVMGNSEDDEEQVDRYAGFDVQTPPSLKDTNSRTSESTVDETELRAAAELSGVPSHVVDVVLGYSKTARPTSATTREKRFDSTSRNAEIACNSTNTAGINGTFQKTRAPNANCNYENPSAITAFARCAGQQPSGGRDPSPTRGRSPTPRSPTNSVNSDKDPEGATKEEVKLLNRFIEAAACFFDGKKLSEDSETRVRSAATKIGISQLFVDQLIEQANSKNMEKKQQGKPIPIQPFTPDTRHDVNSGFYTVEIKNLPDATTEADNAGCSFWDSLSKNFAYISKQARCFDETSSINSSPSNSWEEEIQPGGLPMGPPKPHIDSRRGYV